MLPEKALRKADLITASILLASAVYVIASALTMPMGGTYGGVENAWYVSPAAFPLLLGVFLLLCSVLLMRRALRLGAIARRDPNLADAPTSILPRPALLRLALIVALLVAYVASLRIHWLGFASQIFKAASFDKLYLLQFLTQFEGASYYLSSVLFTFAFTELFYRSDAKRSPWKRHALLGALSVVFPFFIAFAFSQYLSVPLP